MATAVQENLFYNKWLGISTSVSKHVIRVKTNKSCDLFDSIRNRLMHNKTGFLLVESIPDWKTGIFTFIMLNRF